MTPELITLTLAAIFQVLQFSMYSTATIRQVGPKKAAGPRDTPHALTGVAGRLERAMNNHFEGLILFGIACFVITISGQSSGFTAACAWVYLGARILYVPAYVWAWTPWRSAIWMVGLIATTLMLLAALI